MRVQPASNTEHCGYARSTDKLPVCSKIHRGCLPSTLVVETLTYFPGFYFPVHDTLVLSGVPQRNQTCSHKKKLAQYIAQSDVIQHCTIPVLDPTKRVELRP